MPGALSISRPLHETFNFGVFIDGGESAKFSKLSSLEFSISTNAYREAGAILPIKDPEFVDFTPITLETGASTSSFFYEWVLNAANAAFGESAGSVVFVDKRNLTIYQYDRAKRPIKKFHVYGAWPTQFIAGEWDNHTDSIVIERLVLTYDYFTIETKQDPTFQDEFA